MGIAWSLLLAAAAFAQEPAPDLTGGKKIFESQCALCHGAKGTGGRGPALTRPKLSKAPDDATLRTLISEGSPPEMPAAWQLSRRDVANVAAFVKSLGSIPPEPVPGDASHGAVLYKAKACESCHIVTGQGTGFGPELTAIGARRNAAHLREALVNPAAFVPEDFMLVEAIPVSGAAVRGIRANEDSFTVQVKDASGHFHSFRKDELREYRRLREKSAMPAYDKLSAADLDDLVAYLTTLRGAAQ
jgi:putative heme-binding domain-containing protein